MSKFAEEAGLPPSILLRVSQVIACAKSLIPYLSLRNNLTLGSSIEEFMSDENKAMCKSPSDGKSIPVPEDEQFLAQTTCSPEVLAKNIPSNVAPEMFVEGWGQFKNHKGVRQKTETKQLICAICGCKCSQDLLEHLNNPAHLRQVREIEVFWRPRLAAEHLGELRGLFAYYLYYAIRSMSESPDLANPKDEERFWYVKDQWLLKGDILGQPFPKWVSEKFAPQRGGME